MALLVLPAPALASTLDSNFHGHATSTALDPPGQYTPLEGYTVRLILDVTPVGSGADGPWYAWDPTREYTVVLEARVLNYSTGPFWFANFDPATVSVRVFEDDTTPAQFQNPATFEDGTLLLSGSASALSAWGSGTSLWNFAGTIQFTGGSGLSDLECQSPGLSLNDFVDTITSTPPAYDENYDARWTCAGTLTSVDETTFGRVKARYR